MSAGSSNRVRLLFRPGLPQVVVAVSQTPLVPICSSSVLPSWEYFWTMPSPLPAIQTLSW